MAELGEIFQGISDKRMKSLEEQVARKLQETTDIKKEIEDKIASLQYEALGRGSETTRFKTIGAEIAFLIKVRQALKGKDD